MFCVHKIEVEAYTDLVTHLRRCGQTNLFSVCSVSTVHLWSFGKKIAYARCVPRAGCATPLIALRAASDAPALHHAPARALRGSGARLACLRPARSFLHTSEAESLMLFLKFIFE
jgi:hypothetical protein